MDILTGHGDPVCCPSTGHPSFLSAGYVCQGRTRKLRDGTSLYVAGKARADALSGASVIILVPDVWGWNGGRTRAVADHMVSSGACDFCLVPKLLTPPLDGGTDDDGLPPDFDLQVRKVAHTCFCILINVPP
jgi:hypothetical protein